MKQRPDSPPVPLRKMRVNRIRNLRDKLSPSQICALKLRFWPAVSLA
jgi:hypothetical protein